MRRRIAAPGDYPRNRIADRAKAVTAGPLTGYRPFKRGNAPGRVVTTSNGKTNLSLGGKMSPQVCTVRRGRHSEVILTVNLCKQDCHFLRTVFSSFPWKLASVATLAAGVRQAKSQSVPVIVCERDFQDGNWKQLLDEVGRLTKPPRLIVASRFADEHLWAEVLNLGGHDVLARPSTPMKSIVSCLMRWTRGVSRWTRRQNAGSGSNRLTHYPRDVRSRTATKAAVDGRVPSCW
jgi:hypothetical protein